MIDTSDAIAVQALSDVPPAVAEHRTTLNGFRDSMNKIYRRVIDRRVCERLAGRPAAALCRTEDILADTAAALANLARQAVAASIVVTASSSLRRRQLEEAKRNLVEKLLPPFESPALPSLDVPGSIKPAQLCQQAAYDERRNDVADRLVADAARLVEYGFLGRRIQDAADTTNQVAYSFILRRVSESIQESADDWKESAFDPAAPLGSRRTLERTATRSYCERHWTEEHVHHLENLTLMPFETYNKRMPSWAQPLREIVPAWVKPEAQVIEGNIVKEETSILDDYSRQWTTTVTEVEKRSPAIALGDLILAGWSNEDVPGEVPLGIALGVTIGAAALVGAALLVPGLRSAVLRAAVAAMK